MSTTKAFEIPTSVKAAAIKRRFQPASDQPKGAPSPSVKDDLITRIATDKKHEISDGLPLTIDTQPDFRHIFIALVYYANLYYSTIDIKNRSKTSPATVCLYFFVILYAHILVSDLFLRHSPSFWASAFMNDSSRRDYLEFLLALPVPDFLMKFIETLTETKDPRRPHVSFCPSFAGFSLHHDLGRIVSPKLFLDIHTLAASVSDRSDTDAEMSRFLRMDSFQGFRHGNFFGQHLEAATQTYDYASKLFQALESLFNPIVSRSIQRRNNLARTPVAEYSFTDKSDFNPYIATLNATDDNISEMTTVLESVSSALTSVVTFKGQLGTLYDSLSGLDILRHGYSSYALPTWHYGTVRAPATSHPKYVQTSSQRSITLKFLRDFTPANATALPWVSDDTDLHPVLYLAKNATKTENFPDPATAFRKFHARYDVNPRVRVLDPYDLNVSVLSTVVYTGLIIETLEVDGSIVLHPDVDVTLDECNSQVLQSAVPLHAILRESVFTGAADQAGIHAMQRVQHVHDSQKAAISLVDAGEHRIGTFDTTVDEALPTSLPGFRTRAHTSWFSRMYNYIAYKITARGTSASDTNTNVSAGRIVAWSPYRFVAPTWTSAAQASQTYMLLNLRTNYGMNATLAEIAHPTDLLPIN